MRQVWLPWRRDRSCGFVYAILGIRMDICGVGTALLINTALTFAAGSVSEQERTRYDRCTGPVHTLADKRFTRQQDRPEYPV